MASGLQTLSRLYFRQFLRAGPKSGLYGNIVVIAYLWIIEIVFFVIVRKDGVNVPPLLPTIVGVGCLILDLIRATTGNVTIDSRDVAVDPSWKELTGSYLDSSSLTKAM